MTPNRQEELDKGSKGAMMVEMMEEGFLNEILLPSRELTYTPED